MAAKSDLEGSDVSRNSSSNFVENKKVCAMFGRIIKANGSNIKSQQRTEADLTNEEKQGILFKQYEQNPTLFLMRFGPYLDEEDFECFSGDCEIDYLIKKLRRSLLDRTSGTEKKNRRYEALVRLETETDHFSEEKMRERCPFLYEQYIGQFMTDEEKLERDEKQMCGEVKMSSFIFQQMDREWLRNRENLEREQEEECMEEEEDEEVDGDKKEDEVGLENKNNSSEVIDITEEEKLHYHQEFLQIMKHNFLAGLDKDFDYTKVDTNEDYDNLEIINQDAEDKYFDEESDEENGENQETMSTESEEDYLSDKILQKCSTKC